MEGMNQESVMNQAQQIWSMLDDMADNDPQAYRKFLDKHMKEGKEYFARPEPHMCVQSTMLKPKKQVIFVNFCSWKRIPEPKDAEEPPKVAGTPIQEIQHDDRPASMISVAFCPKILELYGRDSQNAQDRDTLIQIAIDYIDDFHKGTHIYRKYKILDKDVLFRGDLKQIHQNFEKTFSSKGKSQFEKDMTELEKNFAPLATESPGSLLNKLTKMADDDSQSDFEKKLSDQSGIRIPNSNQNGCGKSSLIQEISETKITLPEPNYRLEMTGEKGSPTECIALQIFLPGVKSVAECELDISQEEVMLHVEDKYEFKMPLPCTILEEEASAKFSKKTSALTLTMPVKPS